MKLQIVVLISFWAENYIPIIVRIHGKEHSVQFFALFKVTKLYKKRDLLLLVG